ncbi:MAG TPA: STAS domain-containing protein [Candidatus Saccharimonadales bacterium]|jgi:anti-anti-sigma factor|nr:STAS domain-containing protein [Candidatus Saccharimonadales bacterium]
MLNFTMKDLGAVAVFHCTGRIGTGSDDGLRNAVLTQGEATVVVLDLAGIAAMDAAGLGALVDLRARAHAAGKQLKLVNLQPRVEALLQLTRLSAAFDIGPLSEVLDLGRRTDDLPHAAASTMGVPGCCCPGSPEAA